MASLALGCGPARSREPARDADTSGGSVAPPSNPSPTGRLDRLERAAFNRRAVELAAPVFWRRDEHDAGVLDPDELVVTWSLEPRRLAEFVAARGRFTPQFLDLYQRMLADPAASEATLGLAPAELRRRAAVRRELAQGRPTLIDSDFSRASPGEQALARHLERAARSIEMIYRRQLGTHGLDARIPADDSASQALFFRNQGPQCRAPHTEHDPDCHALPEPILPRLGLYPAAIQNDAGPEPGAGFCRLLEQQSNAAALRDHFSTVVAGEREGSYVAVPYSRAYPHEMSTVAVELESAASALEADEAGLAKYLTAAAAAFRDDDWERADVAWRALSGDRSKYYLRVGPDEVGKDPCGWKALFALTFARIDPGSLDWRQRLEPLKQVFEDELAALAGPPYRARRVAFELPDFIDVILSAGDARRPLGAIGGQSLPNWGPVAESGGRTLVMTNLHTNQEFLDAREQQMAAVYCPDTLRRTSRERSLLVLGTVLHETAHNLGPAHDYAVQGRVDRVIFGGGTAGMLEELKARSAELHLPELLVDRGLASREQADAAHVRDVASALALIAEGMYDASGKPKPSGHVASIQLGALLEEGVAQWHAERMAANGHDRGCLELELARWRGKVTDLMRHVLQIKARGDRRAAEALAARWVDADDDWKALRAELAARWLRTPKASLVYSLRGTEG